jgi:predicted glycosyltransferase
MLTSPPPHADIDMSSRRSYLFQVRNRRGMGHLMRALNIAAALRQADPMSRIALHGRSAPPAGLCPGDVEVIVENIDNDASSWEATLCREQPDVVIYDTLLPSGEEPLAAHTRLAYVMRKCLPEQQAAVYSHPLLPRMSAILIPHLASHFDSVPPPAAAAACRFVGPIVRRARPELAPQLRLRHGVDRDDFLLVSTVGGGGFGPQADRFFEIVMQAHGKVHLALPRLRHLVVLGPNYANEIAPRRGLRVIRFEPELVSLLALADLVVAEGGYNTVNELLTTSTPAIFMPSVRGKDDQFERVLALSELGRARVIDPRNPDAADRLAHALTELYSDPAALHRMRQRAAPAADFGNDLAAEHLVALGHAALMDRLGAVARGEAVS